VASPLRIDLRIEGAQAVLAAFNRLPKDASAELRVASLRLATLLAARIAASGRSEGRQAAALAPTVKPRRDRVPSVRIGGTRRIFRGEKDGSGREAYQAMYGSEFGATPGEPRHGFKPHNPGEGYWIWPAVEQSQDDIASEWKAAADRIAAGFRTGMPTRGAP
jgi:hypothetical protein